jgi:ubiquitin-conjugating enzyme E2 O
VIDKSGPSTRVESSNGYTSVSNNVINIDEDGSDHSYDDDVDDFSDLFMDDYMDVDNYTLLQEHFDNANIPPGIEAPVPWLKEYDLGSNKVESSLFYPSFHIPQSDSKNSQVSGFFQPTWPLEPIKPEIQGPTASNSSVQNKIEFVDHLSKLELPSQLLPQSVPSKKKFDATQSRRRKLKLALGAESSTSNLFLGPSGKKKPYVFGSSTNFSSLGNSEAMKLPHGGEAPHWKLLESAKKAAAAATASLGSHHSNFFGPVDGPFPFPGTDFVNPWLSSSHFNPYPNYTANPGFFNPFVPHHATPEQLFNNPWVHNSARDGNNGTTADSTVVTISDEAREEILKKFQNFKQFDTIDDTSDHYFVRTNSSQTQVTFYFNAFWSSFNLNYVVLPLIYFLGSIQRIGLKEFRKNGSYWRRIYQVKLFVQYFCHTLAIMFFLSYLFLYSISFFKLKDLYCVIDFIVINML